MSSSCFHCGLNVPAGSDFSSQLDGEWRQFCCPGCQAVAGAIHAGGLSHFYQFRDARSAKPSDHKIDFSIYDVTDVQAELVDALDDGQFQIQLLLGGISCAACVWLIEQRLSKIEGVLSIRVNATTHRALIRWQPEQVRLSQLMRAIADIGYDPVPGTDMQQQRLREKESRTALMRLAVAGFGMMQVGMVAVLLYAGADAGWDAYFRWLSFIIATPVVLFSARPFFNAALRALRTRHLTMDVPVSLAIGGAYLASVWATIFGGGEVYFDSVSMFTFFLLLGRYLEMQARHRNGLDADRMAQLLPATAELWCDGQWQTVTLKQIRAGDKILVASGSTIPCDGLVVSGSSGVVESLLTGEPDAVEKGVGDDVIAGSMNTDSALHIQVSAVGRDTTLSAIERMVEQAQQNKPRQVAVADRLAGYFVAAVLLVSAVVGSFWWFKAPDQAFWVVLSILVVTCPCALSLASPTAITTAVTWLRKKGLLITGDHVLEALPKVTRVIFDKTGTLTVGAPQVVSVLDRQGLPAASLETSEWLSICAALETGSRHPLAKAFAPYDQTLSATEVKQHTAKGVDGYINQQYYCLGKPSFVVPDQTVPKDVGQWLALKNTDGLLAWICLSDQLRDSAPAAVNQLRRAGIAVELLSGDSAQEVSRVAGKLNIDCWYGDQSPQQKLDRVECYQQQGERVLMVGDGINDVPVLSGAFVSVAMGGATDLAQTRADSVLLGSDLTLLTQSMRCASITQKVIRQNFTWALGYNLVALPAAAMGWIPPWAAAIGMSASSLIVVLNALRIGRIA